MQLGNAVMNMACSTKDEPSTESSESMTQEAFSNGIRLFNLKEYSTAIKFFEDVESSDLYVAACLSKVVCYVLLGDHDSASQSLDLIKDDEKSNLVRDVYRAFVFASKGTTTSILIDSNQRKEAKLIVVDLLGKLLELQEFGAFEAAAKLFEIIGMPAGEISLILGKLYCNTGFTDLGVEELIHAYNENWVDVDAYFILGKLAYDKELYIDARRLFKQALKAGSEDHDLYLYLCFTYLNLDNIDSALEMLDRASKKYPSSQALMQAVQAISRILEDKEEALRTNLNKGSIKTIISSLKNKFLSR